MYRLLFLLFAGLASAALGKGIEENKAFEPFYGDYFMVYSWPFDGIFWTCKRPFQLFAFHYNSSTPFTCNCLYMKNPNFALATMRLEELESRVITDLPIIADIITKEAEIETATTDRCNCTQPYNKMVFRKIDDNFIVRFDIPFLYSEIFGKHIPSDDELNALLGKLVRKGFGGDRVCPLPSPKKN